MLEQLRHKRDVITLESNSGAVALEHAVGRLPDFFVSIKAAYTNFLSKPITSFFSRNWLQVIAKRAQQQSYVTLRDQEMYTPPGLKVDYLTYAKHLQDGAKAMLTLKTQVLQPFAAWLGQKLGNPASLAAITTNLKIDGYSVHSVDKVEKAIQDCFHKTGRLEVVSTYGNVIKRNADWSELIKDLDFLNTAFNETNHKDIVTLVDQCTNLMDQLVMRMEEEPDAYRLSPSALQALSATSYDIGRELEFYGMLRHRIGEFSKAIDDSAEKFSNSVT